MYAFVDYDEWPEEIPGNVFESSLEKKEIQKIQRKAEQLFAISQNFHPVDKMIEILKKKDKKFKIHKLKVVQV